MATSATGKAIGVTAVGVLLVYSGIQNVGVLAALDDLIHGNAPTAGPNTINVSDSTSGGTGSVESASDVTAVGGNPSGSYAQYQALGKSMAASYGWGSGAEWTALNNIVMAESGWNPYAANPTSDARGIAQNINGWSSNYQEGNAPQQIAWLLQYIQQRYGDPIKAWSFHLANGWY